MFSIGIFISKKFWCIGQELNFHPWTGEEKPLSLGEARLGSCFWVWNLLARQGGRGHIPWWSSKSYAMGDKVFLGDGGWGVGEFRVPICSSRYTGGYIQRSSLPQGPSQGFILASLLLSSTICWISSGKGICQKGTKRRGYSVRHLRELRRLDTYWAFSPARQTKVRNNTSIRALGKMDPQIKSLQTAP
jgi:hypothetical protein